MKFLNYKDKKIAYQIDGKGFPVVLLHGFCEDSSIWDEFIEDLVKSYQIIRIDNPGFGKTDVWEEITI
ncbi:MAG TPA: alpha/beta fold hydrolase, partial [Saprospiraceae bacterium]|nr:alpha/beta fold hydrolase [Saprospiraceae bacterium]